MVPKTPLQRPAPTCPKHGFTTKFAGTDIRNGKKVAVFKCKDEAACQIRLLSTAPDCVECRRSMVVKHSPEDFFNWQCLMSAHECGQPVEFCADCGGTGWLHMDNRSDLTSPSDLGPGEYVIGVDGGMFVDRCDSCMRYPGMVSAERAHRFECGCGHGLPRSIGPSTWVGYPGHDAEIQKAMFIAGFSHTWLSKEIIQVEIEDARAEEFVRVLDRVYSNMERLPNHFAKVTPFAEALKGMPMADEYRRLDEELAGLDKNGRSVAIDRNNPPTKFSVDEIKANGCRPLFQDTSKRVSTNREGEPICIMERKAVLTPPQPWAGESMVQLKDSIYALLGQLNEMTFQDQPIEMQRRLDSRRRALLNQMSLIDKNMSVVNDRRTTMYSLVTRGGYEFSNLKKEKDEAVIHASAHLDWHYYRAVFIEVHDVNGEQQPVHDPHNWFYDLVGRFNDEPMSTTKLTGFTGDYVLCIYPSSK
jgi:hypothetical protein